MSTRNYLIQIMTFLKLDLNGYKVAKKLNSAVSFPQ